jgi:hypothetical protein
VPNGDLVLAGKWSAFAFFSSNRLPEIVSSELNPLEGICVPWVVPVT